jgi:hypothetical protein
MGMCGGFNAAKCKDPFSKIAKGSLVGSSDHLFHRLVFFYFYPDKFSCGHIGFTNYIIYR